MTKKKRPPQDYNLSERACPFCHKAPRIHRCKTYAQDYEYYVMGYEYYVMCSNDNCRVNPSTKSKGVSVKEDAVKLWNGEKL